MCVLFQLAAGLSVTDIIQEGKDVLQSILNQAQKVIESFQEQSDSKLNEVLQKAEDKLDEILPKIEQEILDKYSSVAAAAPEIKACLEAQKGNLSEIVDNASKCLHITHHRPAG
jgi:vacuolar-type H+-ATPase subunit E/Vma4